MTIRRRPRPQWRRRAAALAASAAVIYVVAATAASTDFSSAWTALGEQSGLALGILRGQLEGMWSGGVLPAGAALAIGQSPVLLSGRDAVLELRRTEEEDDTAPPGVQKPEVQEKEENGPEEPSAPISEEPGEAETPLIFADNGVQARTLMPSSPEGYVLGQEL